AYEGLDEIVRQRKLGPDAAHPVNTYRVQKLIGDVACKPGKSFFFTLNQDLFIERNYYIYSGIRPRPSIPGIQIGEDWFTTNFGGKIGREDIRHVPSAAELDARKQEIVAQSDFFYVKLHGSQNWRSSADAQLMVIGKGKTDQISREPLLAWYSELFRAVVLQSERRLLVIGYGFRDEHINNVIADAVANHGLALYVISPVPYDAFRQDLRAAPAGEVILQGLSGYYPCGLLEMFPGDQSITQIYRQLCDTFLAG
ncbi:MAG: SIR2 family protein, partial [Armatimonadetes bacterium]|nr:SIR2 family protein [Armatimonadota bacterium]